MHTGEWYCEQVGKVLTEYGPEHFGAIVSDNGGGCERGRMLVTDKYPHLLGHRCMMHGFALTMGSVFGHPWAAGILKACKALSHCHQKSQPESLDEGGNQTA
ncbi:hypothetical protein ABBQ32_004024 [Trebouxia sp. C0010 RCD-2024]